MLSKVKGAVIVTATVIATIFVAYRIPGVNKIVARALTKPKLNQPAA